MKKHNIYAVRQNAENFQTCIWHHCLDCRGGKLRRPRDSSHYTPQSGGVACNASKHGILKTGDFLVGEATVSLPEIAFGKLDKHTVLFAHTAVGCL